MQVIIQDTTYNVTITPCYDVTVTNGDGGVITHRIVTKDYYDTMGENALCQGDAQDAYNVQHPPEQL